jgi:hypothetical protein
MCTLPPFPCLNASPAATGLAAVSLLSQNRAGSLSVSCSELLDIKGWEWGCWRETPDRKEPRQKVNGKLL